MGFLIWSEYDTASGSPAYSETSCLMRFLLADEELILLSLLLLVRR